MTGPIWQAEEADVVAMPKGGGARVEVNGRMLPPVVSVLEGIPISQDKRLVIRVTSQDGLNAATYVINVLPTGEQ